MYFPVTFTLLAWLAFVVAVPTDAPISSIPIPPSELWVALDATTTALLYAEATGLCDPRLSVTGTHPPASTRTTTQLDSPPAGSSSVESDSYDIKLLPAMLDDESNAGETRGMPISHAVIGKIVGGFALFIAVNVVFFCVWCHRRQATTNNTVPASSRPQPRVTVTVAGGTRWRPRSSTRSSTNTVASLWRGSQDRGTTPPADDESTIAGSPTSPFGHGQDVQMLPFPTTPPVPPTPVYHTGDYYAA
ncbi:hypothetical protein FB45DRAFT_999633 [Roridomyces roridus]|uniref:Transmembrane protein n=1 Tax=Roridomyces roridus TaxID=1738132 RepID=A0AAD7CCA8_9AGAR|nr:hypothetical protein FB45DRAFT_999633 [Roridomyces roridus]